MRCKPVPAESAPDPAGRVGPAVSTCARDDPGAVPRPGLPASVRVADEAHTGLKRLGSHRFAFEHQGVVADVVVLGKPIGNGHPIGVVVATREIAGAFAKRPEYFWTFGGSTLSCRICQDVRPGFPRSTSASEGSGAHRKSLASWTDLVFPVGIPLVHRVPNPGDFHGRKLVRRGTRRDRGTRRCGRPGSPALPRPRATRRRGRRAGDRGRPAHRRRLRGAHPRVRPGRSADRRRVRRRRRPRRAAAHRGRRDTARGRRPPAAC